MSKGAPVSRELETWPRTRERDWDGYVAVIATLVGLLALAVSGYTAYLQRQQVQAQVWPRLEMSRSNGHRLRIANSGLGPARIRAVRVDVDGRPQRTWQEFQRALGLEPTFGGSTLRARVLPPGGDVDAFQSSDSEEGRRHFGDMFVKAEARIGIVICYCSVLDDCWLAKAGGRYSDDEEHEEVDDCDSIPPAERFTK
jgi:hypothetical protein